MTVTAFSTRSRDEPIAFWCYISVQAGIVAMYATGTRVSASYPLPVEATADSGVAVAQVVTAALLGRSLLADRPAFVRAAATTIAFWAVAGRLAGGGLSASVGTLAVVLAWLAAFSVTPPTRAARVLTAFLTIGVPVLAYARLEYAGRPWPTGWPAALSPTLGVLTTGLHEAPWRMLSAPLGVVLATLLVSRITKKRPSPLRNPDR